MDVCPVVCMYKRLLSWVVDQNIQRSLLCCADVHRISPATGSVSGGTLLTITGFGFGESKDDISVDIDGVPCEVVNVTSSEINCWTGVPPLQ